MLTNINGTYSGRFSVYGPNSDFLSSEVTLIFDNGRFTGTYSKEIYPAICKGTCEIVGDKIVFADQCVWTANFNWNIMLNGKYAYSVREGELVSLIREVNSASNVYI